MLAAMFGFIRFTDSIIAISDVDSFKVLLCMALLAYIEALELCSQWQHLLIDFTCQCESLAAAIAAAKLSAACDS